MTRLQLLTIVINRARANGFEFKRWYTGRMGLPWISAEASLTLLDQQRRYYSVLFSHDFACAFWKAGEDITFTVPAQTFERMMADGTVAVVSRKPFTRRSARRDAWKYHLREMALAEDPLRYLRKYLHVEEEYIDDPEAEGEPKPMRGKGKGAGKTARSSETRAAAGGKSKVKRAPRPLPSEPPAFLRRPYP